MKTIGSDSFFEFVISHGMTLIKSKINNSLVLISEKKYLSFDVFQNSISFRRYNNVIIFLSNSNSISKEAVIFLMRTGLNIIIEQCNYNCLPK